MNLETVVRGLYQSEINFTISVFWDGGFNVEAGRGPKHFVGLREDLPNSGAVYGTAPAQLRAKKRQVIKSTIGSSRRALTVQGA